MRPRSRISGDESLAKLLPQLVVPGRRGGSASLTSEPRALELLEQIGALRDARAIPHLLWLLNAASPAVVLAAVRTLDALMPGDPANLLLLEMTIRARALSPWDSWWPGDGSFGDRIIAEDQARLLIGRGLPLRVLGLLSLTADGRTRELATRSLAARTGGDEIPFLLLRANDWVAQISECARRALFERCVPAFAAHFAAVLLLVERVAAQRRVDHTELVTAIQRILTETVQGNESLLANLSEGSDRELRRATARLLRVAAHASLGLFESMFDDRDPVVRTSLAAACLQRGRGDELARWIAARFADPSPRIRMLAFSAAENAAPGILEAHLPELLFDPNAWLREFARRKLSLRTKADFARVYTAALVDETHHALRAALAGLGEVGSEGDAAVALPYVGRGSSRTRRVALRTVCALLKDEAAGTAVAALASDVVGLSREASELILARRVRVLPSDLAPLVSSDYPHVRANVLTALASLDRWEALIAALRSIGDTEPRVVWAAQRILSRWRMIPVDLFTQPTPGQRQRILAALARADDSSLGDVTRTLNTVLGVA